MVWVRHLQGCLFQLPYTTADGRNPAIKYHSNYLFEKDILKPTSKKNLGTCQSSTCARGAHEHVLHDQLEIRHHHGDRAEERLIRRLIGAARIVYYDIA